MLIPISAPTAGREMTSVSGGRGPEGCVCRAAHHAAVFISSTVRFGVSCACFYSLRPQPGCPCHNWCCRCLQPAAMTRRARHGAKRSGCSLPPLTSSSFSICPLPLQIICVLFFYSLHFLPLFEKFKWSCGYLKLKFSLNKNSDVF